MITQGLLARLEAQGGSENEMHRFLESAPAMLDAEPDTAAWFALRFNHNHFGIFDAFATAEAREAHLAGAVPRALAERGDELLRGEMKIERPAIVASKLPDPEHVPAITRGVLLSFKARKGHEAQVAQFLRDAQTFVGAEPDTVAWFALKFDGGRYGIFDVFPDDGARFAHLTGRVPRELTKHAFSLLGGLPDIDMMEVVASRFAHRTTLVGLGVD